ncbi:hypothetical protein F4818DRAFT_395467 [Hypoxylon cercidicola]|nr:hypothetical protein F4818DRAFT_395467 [Hypoxylon cercidicola]
MEAAIKKVNDPTILINPEPKTRRDALENTLNFSQERRQNGSSKTGLEPMPISSIPRLRQCYGWVKINGQIFDTWPRHALPRNRNIEKLTRTVSRDKEYIAIIYEYIDEAENDPVVVEEVSDFLWRAGFGYTSSSLARNWKSGVLIDLSDIVHASGYGWNCKLYGPRKADDIL